VIANHNDAQCYVLSAALANGGTIFDHIRPDVMDDPYRGWALALQAVHIRYGKITAEDYTAECASRNLDPGIMRWYRGMLTDDAAIEAFTETAGRERLMASLLRAKQRHDAGSPVGEIADELAEALSDLPKIGPDTDAHPFDDVLGLEGVFADWVLPGLLRHGTRCVLTGGEGRGKTTLVYQLAMGAAYGVSPLGDGVRFDAKRVYVLDVENWHETQVKQHLLRAQFAYRRLTEGDIPKPLFWLDKTRAINLLNATEKRQFIARVDRYQPDLVVMGAGYKLVEPVGDWRLEAQTVMRTADEIRAKTGAAVLIETHAGHGLAGDRNGWRPDGSSYWLRWPEFGLGLEPRAPRFGSRRLVQVHRWRGDRDSDASWPYGFKSTATLPWVPCEGEEFEAEAQPKPPARGGN